MQVEEWSPVYAGEIAWHGDWRLIVSVRGGSYAVQHWPDGRPGEAVRFKSAERLGNWLLARADLPQALAEDAAKLPELPRDCWAVPYRPKGRGAAQPAPSRPPLPAWALARLPDGRLAYRVAEGRGLSCDLFAARLASGWSIERAVFEAKPKLVRRKRAAPSLLDEVRLANGRLAWPVAARAGIGEATFRKRLARGLTPDEAALTPVQAKGEAPTAWEKVLGRAVLRREGAGQGRKGYAPGKAEQPL